MLHPWSRTLVLVALSLAQGACRRPGDEDLGLSGTSEATVALDRLTDPTVLQQALGQRGAEAELKLGAHGFDLSQTLELSGDDHGKARVDRVDQIVHFDADGKGAFHLVRDLDHPDALAQTPKSGEDEDGPRTMIDPYAQGMEAIAVPGRFFVRARFGRFAERRAEPGEIDRLRALAEHVLADDLALLLRFAKLDDRGAGALLGRPTRKLALSRRGEPLPVETAAEPDPRRAWRAKATVSEVAGELELDAETGLLLRASLDARYRAESKGAPLAVHVVLKQEARAARAIAAPADAILAPHRPRPTVERNQLLEGLAPPVGPQGARP